MKKLYMICGAMGSGKTAVSEGLLRELDRAVMLDGDWCWMADPFVVTDETKRMVMGNICHLLDSFLSCSEYENVIFCWVMHLESTVREILSGLDLRNVEVKVISLMCSEDELVSRLDKDISEGKRTPDVIERALERLSHFPVPGSVRVCTDDRSLSDICGEIISVPFKSLAHK